MGSGGIGGPDTVFERGTPGYPERLLALPDPPDRLHVRGRIPEGAMVALVGSRAADPQARRFTQGLSADLVAHGLIVVSGGALGIDTAAHEGALSANGATVAVIGSGFDHMYPPANRDLFARVEASGALVTELEAGTPPARWTFPRRNRIVAALASAVVVVHAGKDSGALITARIARDLGVPLGAVPGNAGDPHARGCHDLLREGAALVEDAHDVLTLVERCAGARQLRLPGLAPGPRPQAKPVSHEHLTGAEKRILDLLGPRPTHIDDIAAHAGLGPGETSAAVLSLEVAGLVEDQGGKNFVRVG